jgi:hypothetical protein
VNLNFDIVAELLKEGFPGAVVAVLLVAVYRLWVKYDQVQEKRIAEGMANQKIIADLTQAVRDLAQVQRARR